MKIAFNLSVNDWVAFQEFHRKKKAPLYGMIGPIIAGMAILTSFLTVAQIYVQGVSSYTWISVVCIMLLGYLLWMKRKSKNKIMEAGLKLEKKHPEAFGQMSMDFEEDGIHIQSSQTSKLIVWDEVNNYEANQKYYFLYSKKGMVYIIPKRDIQVTDDEFETMLDNYLSKD